MTHKFGLFFLLLVISVAWAGPSIWNLGTSPTSEVFNGIASADGNFIIAVGENGTIVHFKDGDSGTLIPSGTTEELYDVYVASPNMAVAAGEDIVLLWDGIQWDPIQTGNTDTIYTGAWISPEQDVVLFESLGQFNVICPYLPDETNQPFCRAYSQPMLTACGNSNDIKMLMASGDIQHVDNFLGDLSNGQPLHTEAVPLFLTAIWAPPLACLPGSIEPEELFAIRSGNEFWHFDGAEWSNMNANVPFGQTLTWLSGTSNRNIIAIGFKDDGMGGNEGVVWIYDGQNWTEDSNLPAGTPGLTDIVAHINLPDLIFATGFESGTLNRTIDDSRIDILAAAENGRYIFTNQLFPPTPTDLSIDKRLLTPEPITQGQQVIFEIEAQNLGSETATNVRMTDAYNPNLQLVTDNCGMTQFNVYVGWRYRELNLPSMDAGEVFTCTMVFAAVGVPGDNLYNYAQIDGVADNNYSNNRSDVKNVFIQAP